MGQKWLRRSSNNNNDQQPSQHLPLTLRGLGPGTTAPGELGTHWGPGSGDGEGRELRAQLFISERRRRAQVSQSNNWRR